MLLCRACWLLVIVIVLPRCTSAADITWQSIGPGGGGWIEAIACDPRTPDLLYVGGDVGGFYRSPDGGRSYTMCTEGLTDRFVEAIAVHPRDRAILLLGMEGGVFKSTDGGKTWAEKRHGFPPPQRWSFAAPIGALCFDPTRPDVVYAGIGRPRWNKDGKGHIYRSRDCGETWQLVTLPGMLAPQAIVSDLEVSPDGAYLLAATNQGLYRSENGGESWGRVAAESLPLAVAEVAIATTNPRLAYCTVTTTARDSEPWNGGVWRSEDCGKTWVRRVQGLEQRVGKRDQPAPMTAAYREIVVDPRDPEVVYVGGDAWVAAGVFKSVDGGEHWARVSWHYGPGKNMDYGWITQWGPSVECLAISPAQPDTLVFGTSGHVFTTHDGGKRWEQRYCTQWPDGRFAGTGLEVTCLNDIVVDRADPRRVYFGFFDIGLLISDDAGTSFRKSSQGMRYAGNCFTVVGDPTEGKRLWAGTGEWGANRGDVCRSDDRGASWQVVGKPETGLPDGQTRCLLVDPASPVGRRTLYVTSKGNGLYRSDDDGGTWRAINGGLPPAAARQPCRLVMDPADTKHLRVALGGNPATGSGIYESRDGGTAWARVSDEAPFADVQYFAADPRRFDTLYLCQREKYDRSFTPPVQFPGGLFKSTDGGRTWACSYSYHFVSCVAVSPVDSNHLLVGTTDHPYHDGWRAEGVLRSTDGGTTWQQEVSGLSPWNVSCITIDPHDPTRLYVGTGGDGVFVGKLNSPVTP